MPSLIYSVCMQSTVPHLWFIFCIVIFENHYYKVHQPHNPILTPCCIALQKKLSRAHYIPFFLFFSFSVQEASEKSSVLSWECNLSDTAMNDVHNQTIKAKYGGFSYNMHSKPELCLTQTQSMHLYKQMPSSLPQMAPCYWNGASWTLRRALNRGVWRISAQPGG